MTRQKTKKKKGNHEKKVKDITGHVCGPGATINSSHKDTLLWNLKTENVGAAGSNFSHPETHMSRKVALSGEGV